MTPSDDRSGNMKQYTYDILEKGANIFGETPARNAMTADLRRLVKKMYRWSKYPSLYARQKITKIT